MNTLAASSSVDFDILCLSCLVKSDDIVGQQKSHIKSADIYRLYVTGLTLLRADLSNVTLSRSDLTYIFNFWHSLTLALSPERQSARMSENKNVG